MRICLVTAFPPSTQRLNEYGWHLAYQLRQQQVQVTVLGDEYEPRQQEADGFEVRRCWRFNDVTNPFRILAEIRKIKPDVVWFNLVYSTFGDQAAAAFFGLCTPLTVRLAGFRTHVTLHHLMENVELRHADIRFPRLYLLGGSVATWFLLKANKVSVLLERYRKVLEHRYGVSNINVRRHGILESVPPSPPDFSQREGAFRILVFGKFGRYKRLEVMLDAFPLIRECIPDAKLVIAGQDHPNRPGYMQSLADRHQGDQAIEFLGYLPEKDIASVFSRCSVAVLPYSSSGGPSGVAHQAAQFGLPIVAPRIDDIVSVATEENLAVDYYQTDNACDLAKRVIALGQEPERQRRMSEQNYSAAVSLTMRSIVKQYITDFQESSEAEFQPCLSLPEDPPAAA